MRTRHTLNPFVVLLLTPVVALFALLLLPAAVLLLPALAIFSVVALMALFLLARPGTEPAAAGQAPVSTRIAYNI